MFLDTLFTNHLDETVELKEGHSGIFSTKKFLGTNESYKYRCDLSATYREVLVFCSLPKPQAIRVSSDDLIENAVIKVEYIDGNKVGWTLEKFKRLPKTEDGGRRHHHWRHKMNKLLGKSN